MRSIRHLSFGMALAAVGPFAFTIATAAAAHATDTDCARGHSCLWEDRHYDGSRWFDQTGTGDWNSGWWHNDDASSTWNRQADVSLLLFDDTNQNPAHGVACVPRKYGTGNMDTYSWEDRVSSMRITTDYCSTAGIETIVGGPKSNY